MKMQETIGMAALVATVGLTSPAAEAFSSGLPAKFFVVAQLPASTTSTAASKANINAMVKHPTIAGSTLNNSITVIDGRGPIYDVDKNTGAIHRIVDLKVSSPGLNIGNATAGNSELGVRGFAYHPDFNNASAAGYLKFYTMSCHNTSTRTLAGAAKLNHSAPSGSSTTCDNVLTEWKMISKDDQRANPASRREVLRYPQLYSNHGTDGIVFDPSTKWLYIGAGDGGKQGDPHNVASNVNYLYGKILRMNPLQPGAVLPANMLRADDGRWSYPASNPGAGTKPGRSAYYVKGLRHPETMFINGGDLIVADIGGNQFEEIDIVKLSGDQGADLGWRVVEGRLLPATISTIPPVAGYTRAENGGGATAIIVGGVPNNTMGAAFNGKVIAGDIVTGKVIYGDLAAMRSARSWTTPMVPVQEVMLRNSAGQQTTLMAAFGRNNRVDLRLAEIDGTIYGTSKQSGTLFRLGAP